MRSASDWIIARKRSESSGLLTASSVSAAAEIEASGVRNSCDALMKKSRRAISASYRSDRSCMASTTDHGPEPATSATGATTVPKTPLRPQDDQHRRRPLLNRQAHGVVEIGILDRFQQRRAKRLAISRAQRQFRRRIQIANPRVAVERDHQVAGRGQRALQLIARGGALRQRLLQALDGQSLLGRLLPQLDQPPTPQVEAKDAERRANRQRHDAASHRDIRRKQPNAKE